MTAHYTVSIIVPVYEQWSMVPALLRALDSQPTNVKTEILLVDNRSDIFRPPEQLPPNATILVCNTPGSYAARNFGVEQSSGEILIFTDADCRPRPGWLRHMVEALAGMPDRLVAGDIVMISDQEKPNAYEMYDLVRGIPQRRYVSHGYAATANVAVTRALFDKLGGFDARRKSGGDADFCRRAIKAGAKLVFEPRAVVEHPARSTWAELTTKARRVKGGQIRHQKSRGRLLINVIRTFLPPGGAIVNFLNSTNWPLSYRLVAIAIQLRLWVVEIAEVLRLLTGAEEERR